MHFCLTTYNQSGNKKEQYINLSGLTVGQAQEKLQLKDETEEIYADTNYSQKACRDGAVRVIIFNGKYFCR